MSEWEDFQSPGSVFHLLAEHIHPTDAPSYMSDPTYYGLYHALALKIQPKIILEIGVRFGYSAICLLHGSRGKASFLGYDFEHWPGSNDFAEHTLKKLTSGAVRLVRTNTQAHVSLPLTEGFTPVDLAHIDGQHDVAALWHDLDLVHPLLGRPGYILVDDVADPNLRFAASKWADVNGLRSHELGSLRGHLLLTV